MTIVGLSGSPTVSRWETSSSPRAWKSRDARRCDNASCNWGVCHQCNRWQCTKPGIHILTSCKAISGDYWNSVTDGGGSMISERMGVDRCLA